MMLLRLPCPTRVRVRSHQEETDIAGTALGNIFTRCKRCRKAQPGLECIQMGWLENKLPRLVSVQAAGCAPIVEAWESGKNVSEAWQDAFTIAFGITVPKALGDFLILEALYATDGCAIAVPDSEILDAQARLARSDGAFICPEGAACFAAAEKLSKSGWLKSDDEVVVFNTGLGIKYPDTVSIEVPTLPKGTKIPI